MGREPTFAGFRLSAEEWLDMDEGFRLQYLKVFIETSPPRADDWVYESYELSLDPGQGTRP